MVSKECADIQCQNNTNRADKSYQLGVFCGGVPCTENLNWKSMLRLEYIGNALDEHCH
jgi:hypothetical protein